MTELQGKPLAMLGQDGELALYRGCAGDGDPVLVLAPLQEHPAPATLARLEQEYELRAELDPAWAVRPRTLLREAGKLLLILDDPGGDLLESRLGQALAPNLALPLAISLAQAIGQVHARGLIHKDLCPAHILTNDEQVRLTGFGLASRLLKEHQAMAPPEIIAGTLPYLAPEQTGRMNRSIDSRSDLYALGVILYRMLTGELPFTAADPMEWIHCHIARQPAPPAERVPGIPAALSMIVMKCLAKTAEERYQTGAGLAADLVHCLARWDAAGLIEPFTLGAHDIPDQLRIPEKLYGRESEVAMLLAAFDRVVAQGHPELVLVSGYSGVGKSSVVNELHRALVPPRGLFAAGKFDQYKHDIPYATLAQAFQGLIRPLLGKNEGELTRWRDDLATVLAPNGVLMVHLIPELKLIIGDQPPVADLPPQEAEYRFQRVVRRFIGVFARPEHPLALFLDDLQWLDAATLTLLADLATDSELHHLLLVGAYRDNEVDQTHPLMHSLDAIRQAGGRVQEIVLAPLAPEDVGRLVADALRCSLEAAAPLARLVSEKTGGNPFFTIQFLTALAEEKLLDFDSTQGAWVWDLRRIHAKGYTDNVVDLMAGKLARLPTETQAALKPFACLGHAADVETLGLVLERSQEAVHASLWEAVRAGLVIRDGDRYTFLHDRVQEAAYALIPEKERPATHLRIGRQLAAHLPPEKLGEAIFDVVNQLNRGAGLIASAADREWVAELDLLAGKRAKTATAYATALNYLTAATDLLPADAWQRRYPLAFACELDRAECEFLTARLTAAAERLERLANRAASLVDLAAVCRLRILVYTGLNRSDRAMETCLDYLGRVGIRWSLHPGEDEVRREYERLWNQLGERPIAALIDLPAMSDPESVATMDVLAEAVSPSFFFDNDLYFLVLARMASLSLQRGNGEASCFGYVNLGIVLGTRFGDYRAGFSFGRLACDLVEKWGIERFRARVEVCFGYGVSPWTRPLAESRPLEQHAIAAAQEAGDLSYASYTRIALIYLLLASGDGLEDIQREAESALAFAKKAGFGLVTEAITVQLAFIRNLRGMNRRFGSLDHDDLDEGRIEQRLASDPGLAIVAAWYWIFKLQAHFHAGDYATAMTAAEQARGLLWVCPTSFEMGDYHFFGALSRAAAWDAATPSERPRHLQFFADHHRQLAIYADNCPENFADRAALAGAELARMEGRHRDAMLGYEKAIAWAREQGFVQNEALANELAGRFYLAGGFDKIALTYLRDARYAYLRWGALGKVKALDEAYPQLAEPERPESAASIGTAVEHLDVATVVRASQAVSSEIVFGQLIETLMRIAVEHAGADHGLLILAEKEEFRIEAEADLAQDRIRVTHRHTTATATQAPEAILRYVLRTRERVLLEDATSPGPFCEDAYLHARRPRSVLCLPLVRQNKLAGMLYLENSLAPKAFTPQRMVALEFLATQAAISLENATLYTDLQQENEERQRAEQAFAESSARLAAILGSALDAIITVDMEQRIILFNAAAEEMFGWRAADMIGRPLDRLLPERFRAIHRQYVQCFADSGITQRRHGKALEVVGLRANGDEFPVDASISQAESGGQKLLTVMLRDVTERKQAEAERQAREAAEMANRAKSEFLANMSHELRSPLNTILGFTRLLERDTTLPEAAREDLGLVLKSGEHLHELIDDVLDMAKLDAGRTLLNEDDFDLDFLLEEIRDMLSPAAVHKGLQLIFAARPRVPHYVHGDPLKLRQILINLIDNAIKFTEQGSVTVGVEALAPTGSGERSRLKFVVTDTGSGIAPDELRGLFHSFVQARAGREARKGTGLGLAISRGFVRLMGGEMHIDSVEGRGTTINFELPIQAAEGLPTREVSAPRQIVGLAPGQPRYRILTVDDHAEARHLLVRLLAPLGFEVREAADGKEAVELWRRWQPDLIWMDMRMPRLDGREAARRIRAEPAGKRPVIIALTASSFEEERRDILACGCDDMLRKPFREAELFAALEKHLAVRFLYQDAAPEQASPLELHASVRLPETLRAQLEDAITRLDPEGIDEAIEAIRNIDLQLAQVLAVSAREFQYDVILSLIRENAQETK